MTWVVPASRARQLNLQTGELTGERLRIKTPQPATPEAMTDTMAEIAEHFNWKGKIGVGFPAVVKQGVMYTAANVDSFVDRHEWAGADRSEDRLSRLDHQRRRRRRLGRTAFRRGQGQNAAA